MCYTLNKPGTSPDMDSIIKHVTIFTSNKLSNPVNEWQSMTFYNTSMIQQTRVVFITYNFNCSKLTIQLF